MKKYLQFAREFRQTSYSALIKRFNIKDPPLGNIQELQVVTLAALLQENEDAIRAAYKSDVWTKEKINDMRSKNNVKCAFCNGDGKNPMKPKQKCIMCVGKKTVVMCESANEALDEIERIYKLTHA